MENYEVIRCLGSGSFGRVYKAKELSTGDCVALKVISKRGKSTKELSGLRSECEIQRNLNHPNIIRMLDSFETKDELVVITEFAHKELNKLLAKEGYLTETRAHPIIHDLVSALFYLHSNRILHRDLKPQNILLDSAYRAKLCDFGFARNMSTGTHVLTSIKGTPLYMAPELIDAQSYNHTADLWSLGCIIYEMLMGAPPFNTTSILNLIKLVRQGRIQWPTFLSEPCVAFLKGLLQKDPNQRFSWSDILEHPFVNGEIYMANNDKKLPEKKEKQKFVKKTLSLGEIIGDRNNSQQRITSQSLDQNVAMTSTPFCLKSSKNDESSSDLSLMESLSISEAYSTNRPLENEEWLEFLRKSIQDVIQVGEFQFLTHANQTRILLGPLKHPQSSPQVIQHIVCLCSIGLLEATEGNSTLSTGLLNSIKQSFIEIKLLPNLLYTSKLLLQNTIHSDDDIEILKQQRPSDKTMMSTSEKIQCVDDIYTLVAHLVYADHQFLSQFCDAVVVLVAYPVFARFFQLENLKMASNLCMIFVQILKQCPENSEIIERTLLECNDDNGVLLKLLQHSNGHIRLSGCLLIKVGLTLKTQKSRFNSILWNCEICKTLQSLCDDSCQQIQIVVNKILYSAKHKVNV